MLATSNFTRKAIQRDGRCRFVTIRRNGQFLSFKGTDSLPCTRVPRLTIFRASSSYSSGPWASVTRAIAGEDNLSSNPSISWSSSAYPSTQSIAKHRYTFTPSYSERRQERGFTLQTVPLRSFHSIGNHNYASYCSGPKLRFYPRCEVKLWLSSSPSSSSSASSDTHRVEKTRRNAPGYATQAKIPIPKSSPTLSTSSNPFASIDFKAILKGSLEMTLYFTKSLFRFIIKLPGNLFFLATNPKVRKEKIAGMKESIKKEVDHYWVGIKLLMADVKTARNLLKKTLQGSTLTRRERKQLLRTVSDLFRLVPMSMFLIIPFMEFALPFALKVFPNMLPSTFQDSLKNEESMKRELKTRIAMAEFFQETMEELAHEQKRIAANRKDGKDESAASIASKQEASASDMLRFLDLARKGEMAPPDAIIQYANYFQDDLTLDNMPRMQLINMCKYMSIPPYGSDSFLRFQLRHRIRMLKEDDQRILWESIDSLTKMELREACQDRGMRSTGLSKEAYKRSLQQWLDLSVNKNVPISLLIMSRTFFLQEEIRSPAKAAASDETQSVVGLADAISGMDKEVLNEVILQVATSEEFKSDPDVRKIQLEVVTHQNEKIKEEQAERDKKKKKDTSEKDDPQASGPEIEIKDTVEDDTAGDKTDRITKEDILDAVDMKMEELKEDLVENATEIEMGDRELSPEEMESISQLLSADPVVKEREHLARIKLAIREEGEEIKESEGLENVSTSTKDDESITDDAGDKEASIIIKKADMQAAKEANESTIFTKESEIDPVNQHLDNDEADRVDENVVEIVSNDLEDPVVARLKKRIESMVDKIEMQLSDVQVKIGDKLHYLDKDMDGILSRVEMADVLSQVLKDLSFEEALEIADEMDENKDGVFTVQELVKWIETNQLVKFESEGRDAEMDKIMESQSNEKEDSIKE